MRKMFIVLGKLLGLVAFCLGLVEAPYVYFYARLLAKPPGGSLSLLCLLLGSVVYMTLSLALGLLLMFRTEKVADWVKLKKEQDPGMACSVHGMLVAGSGLIGVAVLTSAVPSLVKSLFQLAGRTDGGDYPFLLREPVTQLLRLALGLILLLRSETVARIIESGIRSRRKSAPSDETSAPSTRE